MIFRKLIIDNFRDEQWLNNKYINNVSYRTIRNLIYKRLLTLKSNKCYSVTSKWLPDLIVNLISIYLIGGSIIIKSPNKTDVSNNFSYDIFMDNDDIVDTTKLYNFFSNIDTHDLNFTINFNNDIITENNFNQSIKDWYKVIKIIRTKQYYAYPSESNIIGIISLFWLFIEGKGIKYKNDADISINYKIDSTKVAINNIYILDLVNKKHWNLPNTTINNNVIISDNINIIGRGNITNGNIKFLSFYQHQYSANNLLAGWRQSSPSLPPYFNSNLPPMVFHFLFGK